MIVWNDFNCLDHVCQDQQQTDAQLEDPQVSKEAKDTSNESRAVRHKGAHKVIQFDPDPDPILTVY